MTDTFRALCAELLDVIDSLPFETNYRNESRCVFSIDEDVVFRARAALAQPEPEGLTDQELDDARQVIRLSHIARVVLARWGRPAIEPVPEEVEELIQCLRSREHSLTQEGASLRDRGDGIYFGRAADMLAFLARPATLTAPDPVTRNPLKSDVHACFTGPQNGSKESLAIPQPEPKGGRPSPNYARVPVSEQMPGLEDCDAEGRCWWFSPEDPSAGQFGLAACWVLRKRGEDDDWLQTWLPHHALPVPTPANKET